jgi:hypothetical protein
LSSQKAVLKDKIRISFSVKCNENNKSQIQSPAAQFRDLMKARSNEQRLLMGCSMFDTAKQIVQSAIYSQHPGITPEEMRKEIFLRFYGLEFSQAAKEKIFLMFASR